MSTQFVHLFMFGSHDIQHRGYLIMLASYGSSCLGSLYYSTEVLQVLALARVLRGSASGELESKMGSTLKRSR